MNEGSRATERVAAHIDGLLEIDVSYRRLAELVDSCAETVIRFHTRMLHGRIGSSDVEMIGRIMTISIDPRDHQKAPRVGAIRRIHALMRIGHSRGSLDLALGFPTFQIEDSVSEYIDLSRYDRISEIYERLKDTDGPSSRTRTHSEALRYLAPSYWSRYDIDDQRNYERRLIGQIPENMWVVIDYLDLIRAGVHEQIAHRRAGIPRRSISTLASRYREDLESCNYGRHEIEALVS